MKVSVQLHTVLQQRDAQGLTRRLELSLPAGSTVADVIAHLGVSYDPDELLIAVNARMADYSHPLADGDQLDLIPAISGG